MKTFKKFLKILMTTLLFLFTGLYIAFFVFTSPKSDAKVLSEFEDFKTKPILSHEKFNDFEFRKLTIHNGASLPTLVFVHGTIGACIDFIAYMKDSTLSKKANFISYDRVGYSYNDESNVQESIAFERDMLQNITKNLDHKNTILVGYSYGGPIALADTTLYKKTILLAPAVYSKVEPMPWMIHIYNWKITRWLVPDIWKQASKEKLTHRQDLLNFEKNWNKNPNKIISIHGDDDMIVPYSNSEYLVSIFPENMFELITITDAGHGLVWSEFEFIKQQLLNNLD
jgi:pimeloyl-ACP methyl ester carboxylesterase